MVLRTFIVLYNHHHHPTPELFPSCKTEPFFPLNNNSPFPFPLQVLAATVPLSVLMNLIILSTSYNVSFCDWLTSPRIMWRFIQVIVHVRMPFFQANITLCVYILHFVCTHSSVDGRLGCLHILAMVNNAAVNRSIQIYLEDPASALSGISRTPKTQQQKPNNFIKNGHNPWIDISAKKIQKWPISPWKDAKHHLSLGKCKSKLQRGTTSCPLWGLNRFHASLSTSFQSTALLVPLLQLHWYFWY